MVTRDSEECAFEHHANDPIDSSFVAHHDPGGGFVIVPALALLCGLSMSEAIGTSLLVKLSHAFSGFAGSIGHDPVNYRVAAPVTTASVFGNVAGAFAAGRVPEAAPRRAFAWLVLAMGASCSGDRRLPFGGWPPA